MKKFDKSLWSLIVSILKEVWDLIRYLFSSFKSRLSPKSLLGRFILIILLPLICLQIVASMVFFDNHWRLISRRLADDIAGEIRVLAQTMENFPDAIQSYLLLSQYNEDLQLNVSFDSNLEFVPTENPNKTKPILVQVEKALSKMDYPFMIRENLKEDHILVYVQLKTGVLRVYVPKKRFFSSTTYVFLVWMIGTSILLFWIAFLFMKNQVRSVSRLAKAAENFGTGRDVERFKPEGASEVRQAGQAFLQMRNRIVRYLSERTGMLSGVSHDLRTPLTRMKLQLSMMNGEDVQDLLEDIDEMERMLEGYLTFARGEGKEPVQQMEVSTLITDLVEKLRRNGHEIDLHIEQPQKIALRPNDFSRALMNILTNAHRYAKHAYVNMGVRDKFLDITIDDDGPGIPEEKRAEVFKAFYRLDDSRNTKTGGVGLGLTITRDIVLSHGGEITLLESPQGGLRVHLRFPL